jgi:hypothetical protein
VPVNPVVGRVPSHSHVARVEPRIGADLPVSAGDQYDRIRAH